MLRNPAQPVPASLNLAAADRNDVPVTRSRRQPELDALRGLLLVWMTLTHLPTHVSFYSNQPLGVVSAAEGFIFLSALLCGRVFERKLRESGPREVWKRLGGRAARLYGYHLLLLAIAFTVVAKIAVHTKSPSLEGLIDFFLAHPARAVVSSILLIYRPPLLDILPMYILFLIGTPAVLWVAKRWDWRVVLIPSLLMWVAAQFGVRAAMYSLTVKQMSIPFGALGAFDLYAWQLLWVTGLWIGAGRPSLPPLSWAPKTTVTCAAVIASFFFYVRHSFLWDVLNANSWAQLTDKWHLGSFRLLDFTALAILFSAFQPWFAKWLSIEPLVQLGQASLEVFCAHLLVCFATLALVGDGTAISVATEIAVVTGALLFLYLVARLFARPRKPTARPRRED
ncbi:MAG TPA: OpgC domain-containing protein [Bryobacteraceae bacterium]|nr:OpgC domain-containing protein [Bryobacteraceae bacterium]